MYRDRERRAQARRDQMETINTTRAAAGEETAPTSAEQLQQELQVQSERMIMKVLVAVDESERSFYSLRWALENLFGDNLYGGGGGGGGADEGGGRVTVVHVQPPIQPFVYPAGPALFVYTPPALVDSVRTAQEQSSAAILARALQFCKEKGIKAETLILKGDPKEMICQAVEEMHVDLLVVGSRGLGQIKRALLGSVSDYCAHHAKCPVLIVKPPKESHR